MSDKPLWKLLLETEKGRPDEPLSCSDCFSILAYLADMGDTIERARLIQAAKQHLSACPDCQDYYQKQLQEMEEVMNRD